MKKPELKNDVFGEVEIVAYKFFYVGDFFLKIG